MIFDFQKEVRRVMGVSYNKLFKLMIDKKIRKGELCKAAGISSGSLLKISKDENI